MPLRSGIPGGPQANYLSSEAPTVIQGVRAHVNGIHPFARFTTPENTVRHAPIPLHRGTIKYLKERGLAIADNLVPGDTN